MKKNILSSIIFSFIAIFLLGPFRVGAADPNVILTPLPATGLAPFSAQLNGHIENHTNHDIAVKFVYKKALESTYHDADIPVATFHAGITYDFNTTTYTIVGLDADTDYLFNIMAGIPGNLYGNNFDNPTFGAAQSFHTSPLNVDITVNDATAASGNVTVAGSIKNNLAADSVQGDVIAWTDDQTKEHPGALGHMGIYGIAAPNESKPITQAFQLGPSASMQFCTKYNYTIKVTDSSVYVGMGEGVKYGPIKTFTTPSQNGGDCPKPPAPDAQVNTNTKYTLLAPIPGIGVDSCVQGPNDANGQPTTVCQSVVDTAKSDTNPCPFGNYLNIMIKIFMGICAVLAMIMIVVGGLEYMTSELVSSKEAGKERVTHAIFGLLLALGAYAILNTLNPDLLNICLNPPDASIAVDEGENENTPFAPIAKTSLESLGISCPMTSAPLMGQIMQLQSVSHSFIGHATYSRLKRNTYDASKPTAYFDCSSFVNQVYKCTGHASPGGTSTAIFTGAEPIIGGITGPDGGLYKANGITLQVGDLVGWMPGEGGASGHVLMYYGDGNTIEVTSPDEIVNQATKIKPISHWASRIKYIKRLTQ